jgi:hypothetical protein
MRLVYPSLDPNNFPLGFVVDAGLLYLFINGTPCNKSNIETQTNISFVSYRFALRSDLT